MNGDRARLDEALALLPPHDCVEGWLGEDEEGRPQPCPRCRPHLVRRRPPACPVPGCPGHHLPLPRLVR